MGARCQGSIRLRSAVLRHLMEGQKTCAGRGEWFFSWLALKFISSMHNRSLEPALARSWFVPCQFHFRVIGAVVLQNTQGFLLVS